VTPFWQPTRREFATAALALSAAGSALAQAFPAEGTHYSKVSPPAPTGSGDKVEVVEFFMYSCPHCAALEAELEAWVKTLPADVVFRRVPVAFRPSLEPHVKLYYALEALGHVEAAHRKVFTAIHGSRKAMDTDAEIGAFVKGLGLDDAKVLATMKSFSVAAKISAGKRLLADSRIDGVPALMVLGRFTTSVGQAGGGDAVFRAANHLIGLTRKLPR
jgi:thiol:disulfide interchange protein DsbA